MRQAEREPEQERLSFVRPELRDPSRSMQSQEAIYSVEFSEAEIVALRAGVVLESVRHIATLVLTQPWERNR